MTFIVTLIALLIERFFDWSHLRSWNWFHSYQKMIGSRIPNQSPYLILAIAILPLLLGVMIITSLLHGVLYGFIYLLFSLVILLYCLGPQNLWADAFACINALTQGDIQFAADKLKLAFGINETQSVATLHQKLLSNIFIEANRRVFAVVFWFVVLGPVGAVLYRLVGLSTENKEDHSDLAHKARTLEAVLDWIPVRILTFLFALGGHFVQVLDCWRKKVLLGLASNESLLIDCGYAALHYDERQPIPVDGNMERAAISLLDRVFIIALIIIAILEVVI